MDKSDIIGSVIVIIVIVIFRNIAYRHSKNIERKQNLINQQLQENKVNLFGKQKEAPAETEDAPEETQTEAKVESLITWSRDAIDSGYKVKDGKIYRDSTLIGTIK